MQYPNRSPEPDNGRSQYGEIQPIPYGRESAEEFEPPGLIQYWRILRRHQGTWIVFAFAGALLGLLIALPQTPLYRARTSVEILEMNDNFLNFKQVSPVAQTGANLETAGIQTQMKLLQSDSLLERVIAKLKKNMPSPGPAGRVSAWHKAMNLPEPSPAAALDATLQKVAKSVAVHVTGQTSIIEVTVDSVNPQLAARFANTLANEYIEQNLESRWKTTETTSNWLARQLDDMRIKLERSEDALQSYARKSGLLFTDEKTSVSEEKLRQLQQELPAATADRIARQSRYEMAQHSPPDALPDVLNDDGLRDVQSKITDLRRQIAQLSATYTPEYKSLKRAQAELVSLEAAFHHDRAAILKRIKNEYDESARKEKLLSSAYQAQTAQVTGEGEKSIQYKILKREADSNRQLYDSMLQQLKESTIASAMRASNVRVVDPARVPDHPYKPKPARSAGLGLLVGAFLGAVFIVMRDSADRTIQQPGDCPMYLNLPELGIIPSGKFECKKTPHVEPRVLAAAAGSPSMAVAIPGQIGRADRIELITWRRKPSLVAESFRSTLISILFSDENGDSPRVLVVTSPGPEEGKSTVVSNLAIAIAEVGRKVLLIDADMRRPRQHEIFALENKRGLSSLLRERAILNGDRSLGGLIRETEVPGLFVLTSGPETFATTSLVYSSYLADLLGYVREEFDSILIDTPPMLQISDARVLGRMADRVILVVRAGHTTRDAVVAARQRFTEDGTKLIGTILNDWNPKSASGGYYTQYGGYHKGRVTW